MHQQRTNDALVMFNAIESMPKAADVIALEQEIARLRGPAGSKENFKSSFRARSNCDCSLRMRIFGRVGIVFF